MSDKPRIRIVAILFHSLVAWMLYAMRDGSLPVLWWGLLLSWIVLWVFIAWQIVFDRLTGTRVAPDKFGERRQFILSWGFTFLVLTVVIMAAGIVLN